MEHELELVPNEGARVLEVGRRRDDATGEAKRHADQRRSRLVEERVAQRRAGELDPRCARLAGDDGA
jgi:hypothetical protein